GDVHHAAAEKGYISIARLLIGRGASVNAQGGHYGNALQAAECAGHEVMVKLLVDEGRANVNARGGKYHSGFLATKRSRHRNISKFCKDLGTIGS
ncbi:hypothetical protein FPQ18DRAFT_258524, partial [Pyronema domesticum]